MSLRHVVRAAWLLAALIAGAARAEPAPGPATADDFLAGGERGFAVGRVDVRQDGAYFKALAATGANLARVFLPLEQDAAGRRFVLAGADLEQLRRMLELATARRIRLVVVADFAGVEKPEFWTDDSLRQSFIESWRLLARSLGNDSGIAGLDLLNEPNPQAPTGALAPRQAIWRALASQAIAAIRAEHVVLPIVFEPVGGGQALGFKDLEPLADPQVVYSFHYYVPHEITHQHVAASWPRTIPYPAGPEWGLGAWDPELGITAIDRQRLEFEMREVVRFQERYHRPIYVGEFSCVRWAPQQSALRFVADVLEIFKIHGWSWSYHEFRAWPGWDAEIASADPNATRRSADAPMMALLKANLGQFTP